MPPWLVAFWPAGVFLTAWLASLAVVPLLTRFDVVARPNQRSSHSRPTPTAGGIGFVAVILVCSAVTGFAGERLAVVVALCGAGLAGLGFLDDVRGLPRSLRLVLQALAAGAAVYWAADLDWLMFAVAVAALVGWINVYNFMDGIDGIAAVQAVMFAAGALLLGSFEPPALAWLLVAAPLGFLVLNWAPARLFMGDAGSLFLGFATGLLALHLWQSGQLPLTASLVLLAGFWFDAGYTLLVRVCTGQDFAAPHRLHLYQLAAQRIGHGVATALFGVHALAWLLPLAWLSTVFPTPLWLTLAVLPLAAACVWLRAGVARGN